jgi:desulfoferrodoxin
MLDMIEETSKKGLKRLNKITATMEKTAEKIAKKIVEQKEGEYAEKHAPVFEKMGEDNIKIKIGKVEHPMEEEHYIEWIEVIADGQVLRKKLS